MDLDFISPIKILILYGILEFIISSIACIIETSFKCIGSEKQFFCQISTNLKKEDNYDIYIDNLFIFFEKFSLLNSKDIMIETSIILFGNIFYFSLYILIY